MFSGSLSAEPVKPDSFTLDTSSRAGFLKALPFVDSMVTDTLREILYNRFEIRVPEKKIGRVTDPFDPYNHETFVRRGLGKFWFFVISMVVLGLILYFRNAFPNQLLLRLRSLFNGYYFRELITEFGISFTSGSVVAGIISTMVLAQAVLVMVVYSGFVHLNSVVFYLLILLGVVLWKFLLWAVQKLQAYVLDLSAVSRNQTQRQINIDFGISLLLFPLVTLAYFNASMLKGFDVSLSMMVVISVWISLRVILEFVGLFRESGVSFSGILYFCGFEILPHAVLLTALFRMYNE